MAIIQAGKSFDKFFAHRAAYPCYRCTDRDDWLTMIKDQFKVKGKRIQLPELGWVRRRESLRFPGRIVSACLSRTVDHWCVGITVDTLEERFPLPSENHGAVGIDLGVNSLAILSTGEVFPGPKALRQALTRQCRLSRGLSRKQKGSHDRIKAGRKPARRCARTANLRSNGLHKFTASVARRFHMIGIEAQNVEGMLKNRCLRRAISDMASAHSAASSRTRRRGVGGGWR